MKPEFFETNIIMKDAKADGGLRKKSILKNNKENRPLITIITAVFNNQKFLELIKKKKHKSSKFSLAFILSIEDNQAKILTEKKENGYIVFKNVKWAKKRITQDLHKGFPKNIADVFEVGDVIYVKKLNKKNFWSLEQIPRVNGAVVVMNPWSGRVLALSGGFDFTINQFNIDKEELDFLRLNLEFGHKCRKSNKLFQKSSGFEPGSTEYKKCVLNKGIIIND